MYIILLSPLPLASFSFQNILSMCPAEELYTGLSAG